MIEWLQSIGLSLNSDYGYIVYTTACVLAVIVVSSIVSCIFGVVLGIFNKICERSAYNGCNSYNRS